MPALKGDKGAFADLTVKACAVKPGKVEASGSVRNRTAKSADFVLQVRWVAAKGNGILDSDVVVLRDVGAKSSARWSASGTVPKDVDAVCSYSVKRGALDD